MLMTEWVQSVQFLLGAVTGFFTCMLYMKILRMRMNIGCGCLLAIGIPVLLAAVIWVVTRIV